MRHIVLITTMVFIAGLFTVSQAFGSEDYGYGKTMEHGSMHTEGMDEGHQKMTTQKLDNEQVIKLQNILNEKGYNVGKADGRIGPQTEQAIRDFQKSEGLTVTGEPDQATLKAISPDTTTQEFFGLSPEFGQKEMHEMETHGERVNPERTMEKHGY